MVQFKDDMTKEEETEWNEHMKRCNESAQGNSVYGDHYCCSSDGIKHYGCGGCPNR